jgi:adenine deaminase
VTSHSNNHDDDADGATNTTVVVRGKIVDIHNRRIFPGQVTVKGRTIASIQELDDTTNNNNNNNHYYILPGFLDSHVHVESSLMSPCEFARLAVRHGTVGIVTDPHEIANVCGMAGIQWMLDNASHVPFHFFFGAPSCVPATNYETSGATITTDDIRTLLDKNNTTNTNDNTNNNGNTKLWYLAEMMNWPGVLANDRDCLEKIQVALERGLPVDGHAPNVRPPFIAEYANHGITTDHESFSLDEAMDKIAVGLKIQIREGSGARNFEALHPLLGMYPDSNKIMFCCDDTHPDLLVERHVDWLVREAVQLGYNIYDVLRASSKNVVEHYHLPVGLLRQGDNADFILVDNLQDFNVHETWIHGQCVARDKETLFERVETNQPPINFFDRTDPITIQDIVRNDQGPIRVIVAHDGQLVTSEQVVQQPETDNDHNDDILKIINVNRYNRHAPVATAYIRGFGLQQGAFAGSVAHDSHNIVAVGCTDQDLVDAVNAIIQVKGGLSFAKNGNCQVLPLPVAGLMSNNHGLDVANEYIRLDRLVKENGSKLRAPYMTLSFMALLVIPQLKLSDKGLFDGSKFRFVNVSLLDDVDEEEAVEEAVIR